MNQEVDNKPFEVDEFEFKTTDEEFIKGVIELGGFRTDDGVGLYIDTQYSESFKKEIDEFLEKCK